MPHVYFYDRWNAKRHGRKDASFGFPAPGEPPSGYLGEVQGVAETHLQDEAESFEKKDRRLTKRIQSGISRTDLEQQKLEEVERAWEERGKKPVFPLWLHYFFLVLLMAGEFAINELAFRSFEDRPILNFLATMLVGTTIVVCAHFVGRTLKKPDKNTTDKSLMVAAVVIAIAVSWGIAGARAKYIAAKPTPVVSSSRSVINQASIQPKQTEPEDRSRFLWMFLAFQAGAFLAGMLTAYASCDPLEEQRRKRTKAHDKESHAYTDREKAWQRAREKADRWRSIAAQIQAAYVGENTKHRTDGVKPRDLCMIEPQLPEILVAYPEPPRRLTEPLLGPVVHLNGKAAKSIAKHSRASRSKETGR